MRNSGFTLVEMLVVIAVMSIFGILILTIFTRTLKGTNKSQIIGVIKQNGQSVLEQMDKTVRNGDNVVCIDTVNILTPNDTLVIIQGGKYTRYRFFAPTPSANGYIQQDFPQQPPPPASKSDIKFFLLTVCKDPMGTDTDLAVPPQTLTDTNPQTGVSVENGSFTRDRSAGFRDQVTIKFDIRPGVDAPAALRGQIDPISFQTTIQLR